MVRNTMLRITILVFLFPLSVTCNDSSDAKFKIVGGSLTDIRNVPYHASIRYNGHHNCGGAILGFDVILTAAHCVEGALSSQVSVYVGTSNLYRNGLSARVAAIKLHSQYSRTTSENDIAVLKLRGRLPFRSTILPIALPNRNEEITPGSLGIITGWGHTSETGTVSSLLRKVSVPIIDRKICRKMYESESPITETMICAGYSKGGKDACQGDSGGPLVANGKLQGIVSWGIGCARKEYPGVYTQVSKYRDWIKQNGGI